MIIEIYTNDLYDFESRNLTTAFGKLNNGLDIKIKVSKLYKINNIKDKKILSSIASDILIDPIVEYYSFENKDNCLVGYDGYVDIFLKDNISDVVGESVSDIVEKVKGIKVLVRTGKRFYYKGKKHLFIDFIKEEFFNELIHKIDLKEF